MALYVHYIAERLDKNLFNMNSVSVILPQEPHIYVRNMKWIMPDRFTVYQQLYLHLYLRCEALGNSIPNMGDRGRRLRPHKSVGHAFDKYLSQAHPDLHGEFIKVPFFEVDGSIDNDHNGDFQYANSLLLTFMHWFYHNWLPNQASSYFKNRNSTFLLYLSDLVMPAEEIYQQAISTSEIRKEQIQQKVNEVIRTSRIEKLKSDKI